MNSASITASPRRWAPEQVVLVSDVARAWLLRRGTAPDDADDIAQEVVLRFLRARSSIDPAKLRGWATVSARNARASWLASPERRTVPAPMGSTCDLRHSGDDELDGSLERVVALAEPVCPRSLAAFERAVSEEDERLLDHLPAALELLGASRRRDLDPRGCKVRRSRARRVLRELLQRMIVDAGHPKLAG